MRVWQCNAELLHAKERQLLRDSSQWRTDMEEMLQMLYKQNQSADDSISRIVVERVNSLTQRVTSAEEDSQVREKNVYVVFLL